MHKRSRPETGFAINRRVINPIEIQNLLGARRMPSRPNRNRVPGRRGRSGNYRRRKGTRKGRTRTSRSQLKAIAVAASETKLRKTLYDNAGATLPNGKHIAGGGPLGVAVRSQLLKGIHTANGALDNLSPLNVCILTTQNCLNTGWNWMNQDGSTTTVAPPPGIAAAGAQAALPLNDIENLVPNGVQRYERIGDRMSEYNVNYQSSWEITPVDAAHPDTQLEFRVLKGYVKTGQQEAMTRLVTNVISLTSPLPMAYFSISEDYIVKRSAQYTGITQAAHEAPSYQPIKIDFNAYIGRIQSHGSARVLQADNNPLPEQVLSRTPFVAIINPKHTSSFLTVKFVRHNVTYKDM